MELHLTLEQGLVRALDVGRVERVCLLLYDPVVILQVKDLAVDVRLDVVAEAVDVIPELVDRA